MNKILRDAIIMDTETSSLRPASIFEISYVDINKREAVELLLNPNYIRQTSGIEQDITNIASSSRDKIERIQVANWDEAIAKETLSALKLTVPETDEIKIAKQILPWQNKFLSNALNSGKFPHVTGQAIDNAERIALLSKFGINFVPSNRTYDIQESMDIMQKAFAGKTVWIANTPFESRHIGAQLAADESAADFKTIFETRSTSSPNPFYVTGKEVQEARTYAKVIGDWTKVWEAYQKHTPKPGQTAVRDILDVSRAIMSYGKQLGFLKGNITFHGIGINLASQIYAKAFGNKELLGLKEFHKGLEDSAIHEQYVLTKNVEIAEILQDIKANTPKGQEYLQAATEGKGPVSSILKVFAIQENIQEKLHRKSLIQRLSRAYEDFALQGFTVQNINSGKFRAQDQLDFDNNAIKVMQNYDEKRKFTSMNTFLDWLGEDIDLKSFDLDPRKEYALMTDKLKGNTLSRLKAVKEYESSVVEALEPDISTIETPIKTLGIRRPISIPSFDLPKLPKGRIGTGLAIAGAGAALLSLAFEDRQTYTPSVLTYNYDQFLSQIENSPDLGMPEQGVAGMQRSKYTDFGSPYRGPQTSQQVLLNQELLNEREKWLAQQYQISHYDPQSGLFGIRSVFRFANGYTYLGGGTPVSSDYRGLRGQNMLSYRLDGGWKITAEDADTVVLRQKGLISAISSFFGMGKEVSVRLAGLDAPELSHGGRTFGGSQPYAEQAKAILAEKLANAKDIEIVYSADDMSYGRLMGAVFADNKNLNYELVKEGAATHLPYGKYDEAMIEYSKLKEMESAAYQQKRGVWSNPWGQAFYQITESTGQRPTLNTLANKSKIVENASYIELVSALQQTRELGTLPANWNNIISGVTEHYDPFSDNVKPEYFNSPARSYKNALATMQLELRNQMQTSSEYRNKNDYKNKLNNYLAVDTLGVTTSPNTRRRSGFIDTYSVDKTREASRKLEMAQHQNMVMQNYFISPIGHYRM